MPRADRSGRRRRCGRGAAHKPRSKGGRRRWQPRADRERSSLLQAIEMLQQRLEFDLLNGEKQFGARG